MTRRVVVAEYVSLDGVAEDPGQIGTFERRGWIIPYYDGELATVMSDQLAASDVLLLGRTTYEGFVSVWPARSGDAIGERMNSLPKLVVSATLEEPLEWNAKLLRGDVGEEVRALKNGPGEDILVYGSGTLVHTLMQHDLVDVLQLMVMPLSLGRGVPFFKDGRPITPLALTDVRATGAGVVVLTYDRITGGARRSASEEETSGDWWQRDMPARP